MLQYAVTQYLIEVCFALKRAEKPNQRGLGYETNLDLDYFLPSFPFPYTAHTQTNANS